MAAIDISSPASGGSGGGGNLQLASGASMSSTLRAVTDTSNVASPLQLSTTLVKVTSTLRITTDDNPYIDAEDATGDNRFTIGRATSSQQVNVDFASNPVGSTTLVGAIRTYRDGVNLSETMSFIEDGSVGIGTTAPVGLLHLYKSAAATRLAIDGDAGQNRLISYRTGAVQRFGLYVNNTAESGSNAGSNFAIRAYSDAGTLLSTPFFVTRSSGNVGINTLTPSQKLHVVGSLRIESGGIYDGTNSIGTSGQVLSSTGTATAWVTPSGGSPAGTTGAVQFNNAGAFAADSANFFWDDTNDRLGIGTNAPTTALQVNTSSASLNGILINQTGGTSNFSSIGLANGGSIRASLGMNLNTGEVRLSALSGGYFPTIYSNGVEAMRIETNGNTGIGINAPTARLHVKGSGSTSATTSLLVQNSASTELLKTTDDGNTTIGNRLFLTSNSDQIYAQSSLPIAIRGFHGVQVIRVTGSTQTMFEVSDLNVTTAGLLLNVKNNSFANMFAVNYLGQASMGTASPNASAQIQIDSTTRGFLPPRMTNAQRLLITTPAVGLMVYCTDAVEGLYVYKSTGWTFVI
jgi:hypothetical protein